MILVEVAKFIHEIYGLLHVFIYCDGYVAGSSGAALIIDCSVVFVFILDDSSNRYEEEDRQSNKNDRSDEEADDAVAICNF